MKTYGGVDVQIDAFLTSVLDGGGQHHAPASLPPGKQPPVPLDRRLGGSHNRAERRGEVKNLAPTGTRTPIRRQCSPYLLRYPGSIVTYQGFAWLIRRVLNLTVEFIRPLYNWLTASVVYWSEFLATDPEVAGSIPGATRFSEK
jgi:hypothetical protein